MLTPPVLWRVAVPQPAMPSSSTPSATSLGSLRIAFDGYRIESSE
jgi:hypothetical protein